MSAEAWFFFVAAVLGWTVALRYARKRNAACAEARMMYGLARTWQSLAKCAEIDSTYWQGEAMKYLGRLPCKPTQPKQ